MKPSTTDATVVSLAIVIQFLMEVTLGRLLVAPNILVPLVVYLSMNRSVEWGVEGAFFVGLCLDFLTNQPPGATSLALILGILAARGILSKTTAAGGVSFYFHAILASVFSDILFIIFASRPPGVFLGARVLLVFPRIAVPMMLLAVAQTALIRFRRVSP